MRKSYILIFPVVEMLTIVLNTLNVAVPSFCGFLTLEGIFLILIYTYAGSEAADAVDFKCDRALPERMNQLGILTWKDLAQKSGLTRMRSRLVRGRAIATLPERTDVANRYFTF